MLHFKRFLWAALSVAGVQFVVAPAYSQGLLEADAVCYRYDSTQAAVELYYGVLQRGLSFQHSGNSWDAKIVAKAEIWQNHGVIAKKDINQDIHYEGTKAHIDSLGANKLLGAAGFAVPYGPPSTAAFIWQETTEGKAVFDTILIPLILPDNDPSHFALGGLELASSLSKPEAGTSSPFEKAGYILNPNPSAIFGENYTKLYYYTELYIPKNLVDTSQNVEIITEVVDPSGKNMLTTTQKQSLSAQTISVIIALDIDGLPGDSYKLLVSVKHEDAIIARAEKTFYFVNGMKLSEEPPSESAQALSEDAIFALSDLSKLTEAEASDRVEQALYFAPETDRKAAKKLSNLSDKEHFLFSFWRRQDENFPGQPPLTAYHQFLKRLDEANAKFSYQKTIGWKSDRGRVYIVYGPPPQHGITVEEFDAEYKPYIIWDYDAIPDLRLTSGSRPEFVFLDRQGGGNYVLVHSNVLGETSEPDWMTREAYRLAH
jgi:GWxTD domain-containing protein